MDIHDPHANIKRSLDDCETASHANGLIPVKSTKDDQWFVVCMLSGESRKLEDLQGEDRRVVRESLATHALTTVLLDRCHQVQTQEGKVDKGLAILSSYNLAVQHGAVVVARAEASALEAGFTREMLARAYLLLESEDAFKDVPVTKIGDLQASGEDE